MGGAWAVLDGPSGTLPHAHVQNDINHHSNSWGRRLVGHPLYLLAILAYMQHKKTTKRERKRERERGPPQPEQTTNGETKKRKTKTGAGGDLGEVVNEGVWVEGDGRGQDEETLGETQTTHGFVFPQHLERRRKETRRRRPKNNRITKKKPAKMLTGVGS